MDIKSARQQAGLTQAQMSIALGIPKRNIENWDSGKCEPSEWVKNLLIEKLQNINNPQFRIRNSSVEKYAQICKKFSADTAEWGGLDEYKFYTTDGTGWKETADNAHNGVDISWAFHLSDAEIEQQAAEELFEQLMNELDLADSDGWIADEFKIICDKYNF